MGSTTRRRDQLSHFLTTESKRLVGLRAERLTLQCAIWRLPTMTLVRSACERDPSAKTISQELSAAAGCSEPGSDGQAIRGRQQRPRSSVQSAVPGGAEPDDRDGRIHQLAKHPITAMISCQCCVMSCFLSWGRPTGTENGRYPAPSW